MSHSLLAGLKSARTRRGVPVEALANRIGVTANTFRRYEAGSRRIYFDKVCAIADMLGCTLDELRREPADTVVNLAAPDDPLSDAESQAATGDPAPAIDLPPELEGWQL